MGGSADITVIHTVEGTESANPVGVMLMQQMGIMPLILMSLICGLLLSRAGKNVWVKLGVTALLALFIGLVMPGVLAIVPFGMALGVLPREGLTSFWQNFDYPWASQRFLGCSALRPVK
ncbi:hypothetical protein ACX3T8_03180 [Corynebacterium pyruviciproducens]